jgi:hypothetical protein
VFMAALMLLDVALLEVPPVGVFRHLHWSWQEGLLSTAWPLLIAAFVPSLSLAAIGVTSRLRQGWLRPCILALLIAIAVPTVFFLLGLRKRLDAEGWILLLQIPGTSQSLLNKIFGQPYRVAGAELGWGLIVPAVLFSGVNGLVLIDNHLHARIDVPAAIAPFLMSLVSGWVRERSDGVWPSIIGHNLSNIVVPLATLFVLA